jgi:hypothetical protein
MEKGGESRLAATADALKKLESVSDFKYHKLSDKEVLTKLESSLKGLTSAQV